MIKLIALFLAIFISLSCTGATEREEEQCIIFIRESEKDSLSFIRAHEKDRSSFRCAYEIDFSEYYSNRVYYEAILRILELNDIKQSEYGFSINEAVDSIAAITIAFDAAIARYDSRILHIVTKSMGPNEEHWLVSFLPIIQSSATRNRSCYYFLTADFEEEIDAVLHAYTNITCPMILVLVDKKSGQIITMISYMLRSGIKW